MYLGASSKAQVEEVLHEGMSLFEEMPTGLGTILDVLKEVLLYTLNCEDDLLHMYKQQAAYDGHWTGVLVSYCCKLCSAWPPVRGALL